LGGPLSDVDNEGHWPESDPNGIRKLPYVEKKTFWDIVQDVGYKCLVGEYDYKEDCYNIFKTSELAAKYVGNNIVGDTLEDIKNNAKWESNCDEFLLDFFDFYVVTNANFLCKKPYQTEEKVYRNSVVSAHITHGKIHQFNIHEKIGGRDVYSKGEIQKLQKCIEYLKSDDAKGFKESYNGPLSEMTYEKRQHIKLCLKDWFMVFDKMKASIKKVNKRIEYVELAPLTDEDKSIRKFMSSLMIDTNFFFGGTYPTDGWQLGLGIVFVDTVDPKFTLGPEWFLQFTKGSALQKPSYSSVRFGAVPIGGLLSTPWATIKAYHFYPYLVATLKFEYPIQLIWGVPKIDYRTSSEIQN